MEKFDEVAKRIEMFNKDREWDQFHTPVSLAKSISIEANELLECFQWSNDKFNLEDVVEELADVTNSCVQMLQVLGINLLDVVNKKIDKTEKKYPIEKAKEYQLNMTNYNFPVLVKKLRDMLILSQEEFGRLIGVSFASVNRWEMVIQNQQLKQKKQLNYAKRMKSRLIRYGF